MVFIMGIFVGIALSAIVAYFSIIAGFTKDNIVKITNIFPAETTQPKTVHTKEKQTATASKDTLEEQAKQDKDSLLLKKDIVKSDMKIAAEILPVLWESDSNDVAVIIKKEIQVEQWNSPMNFVGYKLSPNVLIIYGIDLANIELQYINEEIYLIVGDKRLALKETDSFIRFPASFFK